MLCFETKTFRLSEINYDLVTNFKIKQQSLEGCGMLSRLIEIVFMLQFRNVDFNEKIKNAKLTNLSGLSKFSVDHRLYENTCKPQLFFFHCAGILTKHVIRF